MVAGAAANKEPTFRITDIKLYVPVVALPTKDKVTLLKQLELAFKITINWNKYQSETTDQAKNRYSNFIIDPSFTGVNRHFSLENREISRKLLAASSSDCRNERLQC